MDDPYAVDRRGFLKTTATATAAAGVGCGAPGSRWRALGEDEAQTLAAACDEIIPPDDDPGAAAAGVVAFIDRQLATRRKRDLPAWRQGLRALDGLALRRHGRPFVLLESGQRCELLAALEKGELEAADWQGGDARAFFERLRWHTMMGFYGDPRHGGNQERVAWRMLGVPDPPIRGRLHEG